MYIIDKLNLKKNYKQKCLLKKNLSFYIHSCKDYAIIPQNQINQ